MQSKYTHIFEPLTIKHMTLKNRIVMTPMGTNYGEQNGEMSFLHINYYEQRAKGGTGLLIVENASVDSPEGSNGTTQLRIDLYSKIIQIERDSTQTWCLYCNPDQSCWSFCAVCKNKYAAGFCVEYSVKSRWRDSKTA